MLDFEKILSSLPKLADEGGDVESTLYSTVFLGTPITIGRITDEVYGDIFLLGVYGTPVHQDNIAFFLERVLGPKRRFDFESRLNPLSNLIIESLLSVLTEHLGHQNAAEAWFFWPAERLTKLVRESEPKH